MSGHELARRALLSLAGNRALRGLAQRYGLRLGASRFVAGETVEQALAAVADLNRAGIKATLDHLGESVTVEDDARAAAAEYVDLLAGIKRTGVDAGASVKLTQVGLAISRQLCLQNMRRILRAAREVGRFVRIDMEESRYVDATLDVYRALREEFDRVGVVLQAYLYRTERDLASLIEMGADVRLVKGAYMEPPSAAFPRKADVDANFMALIRRQLDSGNGTAVATHDEAIIAQTKEYVQQRGIPRDRFEFQMLYGIRPGLQRDLAAEGYRVRCYVPYGRQWYPYFMRRLAERPANVWFVIRSLVRR